MRLLKWVSMLTILVIMFAMLPATVAENGLVIDLEESDDGVFEIFVEDGGNAGSDVIDSSITSEHGILDLDGLEDDLLILEQTECTEALPSSNASGDFDISEDGELIRYRGFEKNVVIPNGVKSIGRAAFSDADFIESVSIPSSVAYIGDNAFSECTKLKSIIIPDSVTETGSGVFSDCDSLTNVQLSNSLTTLSSEYFYECDSLEEISLPASLIKIEAFALYGCDSLKSIILPDGVTDIEKSAFGDCESLESVSIPSSITIIDRQAFSGCENVVIRGIPNSYAESFANALGIPFNAPVVTINEETEQIYDEEQNHLVLYINQSYTLNAIQKPADLARTLNWTSSDSNIVTVDQAGTIKGVSQGIATIFVNTADGKGKGAQIIIHVPEPVKIELDSDDYDEIYIGQLIEIVAFPNLFDSRGIIPIEWTTSDKTIISIERTTIDSNDHHVVTIKGQRVGNAIITATTSEGVQASIEIEVIPPDAESIKIDQSGPIKLYPSQKCDLTTTIEPAEAAAKLEWYSWNTDVATVDQDGTVTAVKPGEARIVVVMNNYFDAYIDIYVLTPPQKITLTTTKATLAVGDTLTLKKKLKPENAETNFIWSSSSPSVATVSPKGEVTALKVGTAKITVVTDNGKKASASITVKPAPKKVKLNKAKVTLGVREKLTLMATVTPSGAFTTLTWKSSAKTVAVVSKQGEIIPKKPGTAIISVSTANGKTAKVTVTVKAAPKKITLNKSGTVELKKGKKLKLKATLPKDTASALTWTSSKPKVASVDKNGMVSALKNGTAVIAVKTFNGKTTQVTIRVV